MESRILGDYKIIKSIGQGSLGTVYLAEHRFMKQPFVLKVLPEELASDRGFVQRFEDEVNVLSMLDHPNIVKIHNVSFANGLYFLVTDCIVDDFGETTNLAQYMLSRGKRLDEEEIYRLLKQVAEALDYAHSKKPGNKGIAHRNLKLNNILVGKGRGAVDLYICDFGLSRIIGSGGFLTRTFKGVAEALGIGSVLNLAKIGQGDQYPNPPIENQKLLPLHSSFLQNYAFFSPEQKKLDYPLTIDAKSDVYAFGVLCYFLLMNEYPEGYFEMPQARYPEYRWYWDQVIRSCLNSQPSKRPDSLVTVLELVRQGDRVNTFSQVSESSEIGLVVNPKAESFLVQSEFLLDISTSSVQEVSPLLVKLPFESHHLVNQPPLQVVSSLKPILQTSLLERPALDMDPAAAFQVDPTVKHYNPERKEIKNIQPIEIEMVVIEGGTFYRGSNDGNRDEMPKHQITLTSFAIDIHPVTNEQFLRFIEVMGGEKDSNHNDIIRLKESRIKRSSGKLIIESGYAKHPVVGVTWYGAVAYAKWVGKRLPTEAEWEIAACGGLSNALYPPGEDIEKNQANFFSSDTTAVMSYAPNMFGLYDMAGNVYEWCYDWYDYNYYQVSVQEPENPQGPLQGVYRVLRGGCWKSLKEDLRCSRRHRNNPGTVNGTYGFRCTTDVQ